MSAALAVRSRHAAAAVADRLPAGRARPLAEPPPGSGLLPVMGEPGLPLLGKSLSVTTATVEHSRDQLARFGTVSWINAFGTPMAFVLGPDAIGEVLANRDRAFSNERGWGYFIGPFFERGVMLMDFEEHRHHRRIMQEAFRRERLERYLATMGPAIERGIAGWRLGPGFELYTAMKQLTLDLATEVFAGGQLGPEARRIDRAFIDCVLGGQTPVRVPVPGGRWHRGLRARRVLEAHFRAQLPAKRAGDGDDLLSVLCRAETEDGERFGDDDVVDHMIFVLMAAHDTSTITAAMLAYYLAVDQDWQERLREESRAIGRAHLDHDDLDALPSLDLAFKETLRMNGPVGVIGRETLHDTALDGRFLPAGTRMMLGLQPTMRMEPWWRDPDRFDPERFAEHRREDRSHPFAWVPFGGHVHKCIGMHFGAMEVKAIVHQLLLRARWSVPRGYEPLMDYGTGPFPGDGLPLDLRPL